MMRERLWQLLAGTDGGVRRTRIIQALDQSPANANQLADRLDLGYNTVRYHLGVLREADVVKSSGASYGEVYFLTDRFEPYRDEFERIVEHHA